MTLRLCLAFLFSGAAALLFETVWFRLAGLGLGNSVWASSAVLASFMAGLALGNCVAASRGERVRRPLHFYAAIEIGVGLLGLGLVLVLPGVGDGLAPLLGRLRETPSVLNLARGLAAFGLMLVPATAMGMTLPLLTRALAQREATFGVALGRLYGWNTLGGVAGAVAGEALLVERLGILGTAVVAAGLNLAAAVLALRLAGRRLAAEAAPAATPEAPNRGRARVARALGAAFLCGAILLGLEVVWVRLMQLFVFGTQLAFALMLATVLAGIGLGGLLAAAWLARRSDAFRWLGVAASLAGIGTVLSYAGLEPSRLPAAVLGSETLETLLLSLWLMAPTALVSGVIFTLLGAALRTELDGDAAAAGWLTLANTIGAALGAPLAGLVMLPWLGVDGSVFLLAIGYALVAWLVVPWSAGRTRAWLAVSALGLVVLGALFPFGALAGRFVRGVVAAQATDGSRLVALREGATETALLLQKDWGGLPLYQKLITNAHSMTSSVFWGRRYMKLFAFLPLALRPDARRALLISYGMGNTAEALRFGRGLERIDVVDVSRTILGMSPLIARAGAPDPLLDPRVRVLVEDGRFHLLAGGSAYDVITAEPPPPHGAGIANLYSLEYFRLVRRRLARGGVVTHWLPVNQLPSAAARAVVRAFCLAFDDCSLWSGAGYDWMLLGTNGTGAALSEERFARLWREAASELRGVGIQAPEDMGALFIADAATLGEWTVGVEPLVDDRPGRLGRGLPSRSDADGYRALLDARACATRFRASAFVRRIFSPALRERSLAAFEWRGFFDADYEDAQRPSALADLREVLERSRLTTLPLLLADSEPRLLAIARLRHAQGERHPLLSYQLGAGALADRDYPSAADLFAQAGSASVGFHSPALLRALALDLAGRRSEAAALVSALPAGELPSHAVAWRRWLAEGLGVRGE